MEPISAFLFIVGAYGVKTAVGALGGGDQLGEVASELFKALGASESRINERLTGIENRLDQLLEKPYEDALRRGVRYFVDAAQGRGAHRATDLDHAREAFVAATSSSRSPLQEAIAERYLLFTLLAQRRLDIALPSLERMEAAATSAAFEAAAMSEFNRSAYQLLLRNDPKYTSLDPGPDDKAYAAARESLGICSRLLCEGAALAPELGLAPRAEPPRTIRSDEQVRRDRDPILLRGMARAYSSVTRSKPVPADYPGQRGFGKPDWIFEIRPGSVLRIGSLVLELSTSSAARTNDKPSAQCVVTLRLVPALARPIDVSRAYPHTFTHGMPGAVVWATGPFGRTPTFQRREVREPTGMWETGSSPEGIEVPAHTEDAVLSFLVPPNRALWQQDTVWSLRDADTSRTGIRLNPVYTLNNFIIVSCIV